MKKNKKKCTAIVLAAGQGKRMGNAVQKQYIELNDKPVICYTLDNFERSEIIDNIILVVGEGQEKYVREKIVLPYHYGKVSKIVPGGKERYHSVWEGLKALNEQENGTKEMDRTTYVFIHDGARMFADESILKRGYETVEEYKACVAGMPSKDTIKLVDDSCQAVDTPERKYVWAVQTPQIFERRLITEAYARLMEKEDFFVTDDAMVVEKMLRRSVKLFEGSYTNIKLTTPEDLEIAKVFLEKTFLENDIDEKV